MKSDMVQCDNCKLDVLQSNARQWRFVDRRSKWRWMCRACYEARCMREVRERGTDQIERGEATAKGERIPVHWSIRPRAKKKPGKWG